MIDLPPAGVKPPRDGTEGGEMLSLASSIRN
jgi:hypothetical protein